MATITLNKTQIIELSAAANQQKATQFFIAKDEGAYIGVKDCIFYFKGCNPEKNVDWWETCNSKFGGDDFGEFIDIQCVHDFAEDETCVAMKVIITEKNLSVKSSHIEKAPTPNEVAQKALDDAHKRSNELIANAMTKTQASKLSTNLTGKSLRETAELLVAQPQKTTNKALTQILMNMGFAKASAQSALSNARKALNA